MPLVTSKEMLLKAQEGGYAVGAFNAENMEMVKAIIQAAEELKAPVMIQTTPSTVKYGTVDTYAAIVAAEAAAIPACPIITDCAHRIPICTNALITLDRMFEPIELRASDTDIEPVRMPVNAFPAV